MRVQINHACDGGNLTIQTVFAGRCCNTLLYYTALFATHTIKKGDELTYNYHGQYKVGHWAFWWGSKSCRGADMNIHEEL